MAGLSERRAKQRGPWTPTPDRAMLRCSRFLCLAPLLLGRKKWFRPPDLDRPGRQPHQQGPCEARLGYQDESPGRLVCFSVALKSPLLSNQDEFCHDI